MGLIEGIAVAADWRPYGEMTGHQMAAALQRIGLSPPLEALFGHGFLAQASSRSYISAGSFCRYLMERQGLKQGMKKLTALYRTGGDFTAIYGQNVSQLLKEWTAFLKTVQVPPRQLQLAEETFRRPSILKRVCGHEVANLRFQAENLRAEKKTEQALEVLKRICSLDPGDPMHQWERMTTLAEADRRAEAMALGESLLTLTTMSKPMRRSTLALLGDLAWRSEEIDRARERYEQAAAYSGAPSQRRLLYLKRWALRQPDELRTLLQKYLVPETPQRDGARDVHLAHQLARELPSSGLGLYLVGKQLAGRGHWALAITPMRKAIHFGLPNQDFIREARRVLGSCSLIEGDIGSALRTFSEITTQTLPKTGDALRAVDWQQRAQFRGTGKVGPQNQ